MADERDEHTPAFRLDGMKIHKNPVEKREDGGTTITLGFPVCTVSEWVKEPESILGILNRHSALQQCAEALRALVPDMAGHPDDYTTEWHDAKDALDALTAAEAGGMTECKHPIWLYMGADYWVAGEDRQQRHKCIDCGHEERDVPDGAVLVGHRPGECRLCTTAAAMLSDEDRQRWLDLTAEQWPTE